MYTSLKYLVLTILAISLVMSSCSDDNDIDIIDIEEPTVPSPTEINENPLLNRNMGNTEQGLNFECFIIQFPFQMRDVDDNIFDINDEDDLLPLEDVFIVDFVYPLTVTNDSEEEIQIEDTEALGEIFASCIPIGGWEDGDFPAYLINEETSCYSIVYPISLQNQRGETITLSDEEAFNTAISVESHNFVFPFEIENEEEGVILIEDIDALFEALFSCNTFDADTTIFDWEVGFEYLGCYLLEFPFEIVLTDSTEISVNNHEEYCEFLFQGNIEDFVYPITLIDENGNSIEVNSQEELNENLEDCFVNIDVDIPSTWIFSSEGSDELSELGIRCYDITYPFESYDFAEASIVEINDESELIDLAFSDIAYKLVYPVNVTVIFSGENIDIENDDDLIVLISECQ